ncbi:hypothetical protein QE152_g4869 [Popillia japonica]|uniref:Uncharacterized protein n=1 Tax=Popillia japonica TaxID=7064 RepID=A0AAW1MSF9_POPJA
MEGKIYLILNQILSENLKTLQRVAFVDPLTKFPAAIPPGFVDAGVHEGLRIVWGVERTLLVAWIYH